MTIEVEEEKADGWLFVRFWLPKTDSEVTSRGVLMLRAEELAGMKGGFETTVKVREGEEDGA